MKKAYLLSVIISVLVSCSSKPDYDATGIFEATTVIVSAETAGKIHGFNVSEGDSVVSGQLLAVIDTTMLSFQQRQIMHQQTATKTVSPDITAQASALRSQIEHQKHECERFGRLLADGATTQKTYDDAQAQLAALRGQLEALLSTLGKNRSSIANNTDAMAYQKRQIAEQIAKSKITSPLTGTVLVKYAETGEYATPGKPLLEVADLGSVYLRSYFTVSQLAEIRIGQKVTVIADFGDRKYEYPGTITWIAQESEFTPKSIQTDDSRANLVYAVKVAVKNDGRLKLGQYGEVRL
ncbi:MAG: HlyD family efflux transporter periplasmic adaptor subunit [Prevotella sp.]|nr:HlyD family efflux transporter periplasmic adaptor subunit [Prevotella sp.]